MKKEEEHYPLRVTRKTASGPVHAGRNSIVVAGRVVTACGRKMLSVARQRHALVSCRRCLRHLRQFKG